MADKLFTPLLAESAVDDSYDPWKIAIARFLESLDEKERNVFNEATSKISFIVRAMLSVKIVKPARLAQLFVGFIL